MGRGRGEQLDSILASRAGEELQEVAIHGGEGLEGGLVACEFVQGRIP